MSKLLNCVLRWRHLTWPGDLTWYDLGPKFLHKMRKGWMNSYAKFGGAARRHFSAIWEKPMGGGGTYVPPPAVRGLKFSFWNCRYIKRYSSVSKKSMDWIGTLPSAWSDWETWRQILWSARPHSVFRVPERYRNFPTIRYWSNCLETDPRRKLLLGSSASTSHFKEKVWI